MRATASKNAESIEAEMTSILTRMSGIREEANRELVSLSLRLQELQGELAESLGQLGQPVAAPLKGPKQPVLEPLVRVDLKGHKPAPTLPEVTGEEKYEGRNLLLEAVGNLKEWCAFPGRPSYSAAKSWISRGESTRRSIPDRWAQYFLKNHGIPLDFWPHGITKGYPRARRQKRAM